MRRILTYGFLAVVVLGVVAVLAIGAWLNDARLTQFANDAAQNALPGRVIHVGQLHRDGWHTLVVTDVHVSAPGEPGRDTARVKRAQIQWHWTPLLRRQWVIEDIQVQGVDLDLVSDAPSTPADGSLGYTKPNLPLRVLLRQGTIDIDQVRFGTSAQTFRIAPVHIDTNIDATNDALHGQVTVHFGSDKSSSVLTLDAHGERVLSLKQAMTLTATAHDWLSGSIGVTQDGQLALAPGDGAPPPIDSHAKAALRFDAAQGEASIEHFDVRFGDSVKANIVASLRDAWQAPTLQLDTLAVNIDLNALRPLVHHLVPGLRMGGTMTLDGQPATVSLGAPVGEVPVTIVGNLNRVSLDYAGITANNLTGTGLARYGDEAATVAAVFMLGEATTDTAQASDLSATLWATLKLPGNAVDANAPIALEMQLDMPSAQTTATATGRGLSSDVYATGTLGWFQGASAQPLSVQALARWATITMDGARLGPGSLSTTADVADPKGRHVRAQLSLTNARVEMPALAHKTRGSAADDTSMPTDGPSAKKDDDDDDDDDEKPQPWVLPPLRLQAGIARRGDDVSLQGARMTLGRVSMVADIGLAQVQSDEPRITRLNIEVPTTPLVDLVALSRPPRIDSAVLRGTLQAKLSAQGDVPYQALAAQAALPRIDDDLEPDDFEAWEGALHAYAAWARGWTRRFDAGFPLTLHGDLTLADVDYSNAFASVTDLALQAQASLEPHSVKLQARVTVPEAPAPTPTPVRGVVGTFDTRYEKGLIQTHAHLAIDDAALANQPTPLKGIGFDLDARYAVDGDMHLDTFDIRVANRGFSVHGEGLIEEPLDAVATRAWLRPGFANMRASTHWRIDFAPPNGEPLSLAKAGPSISGQMHLDTGVELAHGMLAGEGGIHFDDLSVTLPSASLSHVTGSLPMKLSIRVGEGQDAVTVARNLSFGGGVLSVVSDAEDIRNRPARPVYYDRLRPYRQGHGIRAAHAQSGPYEVTDIALEGRIENGMLLADWVGMNILGGDVAGNFGLQLGRDSTLRGDVTLKASNIDASYFPILHLKPGLDSEMSADTRLSFLLGEDRRDVSANVNVTKLGPRALDRFLQLLDPTGANASLQRTRSNLWLIGSIREIAMWVRFENLNMDIQYVPLFHIPFTDIGYRLIDRELLRRLSLTEILDLYEPMADAAVGPILGWKRAH